MASPVHYSWQHSLSEIVQAIIDAGLVITRLAEGDRLDRKFAPWMENAEEGRHHFPAEQRPLVATEFTLEALRSQDVASLHAAPCWRRSRARAGGWPPSSILHPPGRQREPTEPRCAAHSSRSRLSLNAQSAVRSLPAGPWKVAIRAVRDRDR